jgi:chemotaxis protein MotA
MDPATLIGVVLAFIAIFAAQILEGGSPMSIMLLPPLILIFFGSAGAALASNTMPGTIAAMKWLVYALKAKKPDFDGAVEPLVKMAERARREGLLALEPEMETIDVLENLSEPAKLGHLIAGAFVATLWGVLSANALFLPFGKRIKLIGDAEAERMELIIEGVLAIQSGANPRVVATRLRSKAPSHGPTAAQAQDAA